jgi:hypothetical protein
VGRNKIGINRDANWCQQKKDETILLPWVQREHLLNKEAHDFGLVAKLRTLKCGEYVTQLKLSVRPERTHLLGRATVRKTQRTIHLLLSAHTFSGPPRRNAANQPPNSAKPTRLTYTIENGVTVRFLDQLWLNRRKK